MKLSVLAATAKNALEASGDMEVILEIPKDELKVEDTKVIDCKYDGKKYFFVTAEGCENND